MSRGSSINTGDGSQSQHSSSSSGSLEKFSLFSSLLIMKYFLAPLLLASVAMTANIGMNIGGGGYNFGYATGDSGGHSRVESGNAGTVSGSYSYVDPNGDLRTVQYTAGPQGYQASGDTGVDRRTAAAAAALNAMAPKAPPAAPMAAPVNAWQAPAAAWQAPAQYAPVPNIMMGPSGYAAKW